MKASPAKKLVTEKDALDRKIAALDATDTGAEHPLEQARIKAQRSAMLKYSGLLADRIKFHTPKTPDGE
ncbi:MAG: hypothetical protein DRJ50_10060 [Actinobacteria bacterium]|nr:MAG: hypothetical protein DRJ50_10060 [Actinomycetota bacterium]